MRGDRVRDALSGERGGASPAESLGAARSAGVHIDAEVLIGDRIVCPRTQLDVSPGQIVGLTGPSGCGKTTLLHLLVADRPAGSRVEGSVEVAGISPFELSDAELREHRRERVALVGQDPGAELNPTMSVRRLLRELSTDGKALDVDSALGEVQLDAGLASRRVHQISGGQQRRVALARALTRRPDVLVLDEPFSGLDRATARHIGDLLRGVAEGGACVILTGHDGPMLDVICDRQIGVGTSGPGPMSAAKTAGRGYEEGGRAEQHAGEPDESAGLSVRGLTVCSPSGHVLIEGLDTDLPRGSLTALLGPSGSGKSTLLRTFQGRYRAEAGTVLVGGRSQHLGGRRRRGEVLRAQLVPQDPLSTLNPSLSALAAVTRAARHHPEVGGREAARVRARELLCAVRLSEDLHERRPGGLSGGQRQRVAIARAIAPGPEVLLCDEVTSALDAATAHEVADVLASLAADGVTVVLATHDEPLAAEYCAETIQL